MRPTMSSRKHARSASLALMASLALLLAACGEAEEPAADPGAEEPGAETPGEPEEPGETPEEPDEAAQRATVHFARSAETDVFVEPEVHVVTGADVDERAAPFEALFGGVAPHDPALFSAVPDGVGLLGVSVEDAVLTVDVDGAMASTSGASAEEVAFAGQLAHTAAELDGIDAVRLTIDGAGIEDLWGHLDWSEPFEPDPFQLSPITIEVPAHGDDVTAGSLTVSGQATVFEAMLMVRLLDDTGTVLDEAPVMASEGGPGRGSWSHEFEIDAPGTYTVQAEESDPSGGEGRPPFATERTVQVG